ncbi:hypothetical protein QYF61_010109 [Mycteria americana]|uniref:Uncharacterized protein n=1 Tax=Mycteria americana TaxID=33587 RepID=A0AAN7S6I7_MYCAM|nr:hypothetical protein QYF61_010109 [Mycteria americana]
MSSQIMHTNTEEEDGYSHLNHLPQDPARHYMSLNINKGPACSLCPVNWKWVGGDTCFYFSEKEATWQESEDFCFSQNATLLTLKRKSKLVWFQSYWNFFALVSAIQNSSPVSKYLLMLRSNRDTVLKV